MLGGEAGSMIGFILPDQTHIYFSFWAYNTANIQFPCQTCLTHICCMSIRLWIRCGPKVQRSVSAVIPLVSESCSARMLLWFLGCGLFPLKKEHMRLHAWPAKSDKGRLVPRPERPDYFQTKAQGHALTYKRRPIVLAHFGWRTESFSKTFLENPTHETCSKLHGAVWDLWPFLQGKNAADLRGEWGPGIQSRWRAEAFSLTWSRGYSCKPCFSGSQLWRLLSQFLKKQDSLGSFWLMGFIITRTTCTETIRKNSALDQPKRLFLGPGQSCFFHLCWVLKLQSQNFLKKLTVLLTWTQTNHRTPLVPPIVNREPFNTHSGKTWFPPIFTFKYLKFGTVQVPPAAPAIQRWRGKLFPLVGKRHCRGHGPSGILAPRCSKVDLLVDLSGVCLKIDEHRVSQIPWFINMFPTLKWPFVGIFRFQTLLSCVRCLGKTQRFQGTPLHSAQD